MRAGSPHLSTVVDASDMDTVLANAFMLVQGRLLLADDFGDGIGVVGDAGGDVDDKVRDTIESVLREENAVPAEAAQPVASQPDAAAPAPLEESNLTRVLRAMSRFMAVVYGDGRGAEIFLLASK